MKNVLYVCSANTCRSPAAEAVLKKLARDRKLEEALFVDSCGIHCMQQGISPDSKMAREGLKRGFELYGKSQIFSKEFLSIYDYIFVATHAQLDELKALGRGEILLMTHFSKKYSCEEIPDPYAYPQGFEMVFDILEDSCQGTLNHIFPV